MLRLAGAAVCAALLAEPASARAETPRDAASRAFEAGAFLSAADAAQAGGEAGGLTFAARSLLAACVAGTPAEHPDALIERAIDTARAALDRDPNSVEARLNLALGIGLKGRRTGRMEALRKGYAATGRRLIEDALAMDPDNAWAHALMGGWSLEVLRRGGKIGAKIYGADFEDGVAHFDRARALAPTDPAIAMLYGAALLELDPKRHAEEARAQFEAAAAGRPKDALGRMMRREAMTLLVVMDEAGPEAAAKEAGRRFS